MSLILPRRFTSQPQGIPVIDQSNPLSRGLVIAMLPGVAKGYNAASRARYATTGTKVVATPTGRAVGFGSTYGAGTSDKIPTIALGPLTQRSYFFRARKNGVGGGSLGRLFDKTNGTTGQYFYFSGGSSNLTYTEYWGGSEIGISVLCPASGVYFDILVTTLNNAYGRSTQIYLNGSIVADESSIRSGLSDAASTLLTIGNRNSDGARGWDGLIECAYVWNRVLSPYEAWSLSPDRYQIFQAPPRRLWVVGGSAPSTTPVNADLAATYNVSQNVNADLTATYAIDSATSAVNADLTAAYNLINNVHADLTATFTIVDSTPVNADLTATYGITQLIAANLAAAYTVFADAPIVRAVDVPSYTKAHQLLSNTITIDKPAGTVVGDLLMCVVTATGQGTVSDISHTGWEVHYSPGATNPAFPSFSPFQVILAKVATGVEPSNYTFNFTYSSGYTVAASAVTATMIRVTGASTTSTFDVMSYGSNFSFQVNGSTSAPPYTLAFSFLVTNKPATVVLVATQINGAYSSTDTSASAVFGSGYSSVASNTDMATWQAGLSTDAHSVFIAVSDNSYIPAGFFSAPQMSIDVPAVSATAFMIGIKPAAAPPTTTQVAANLVATYSVAASAQVGSNLAATYNVLNAVSKDLTSTYILSMLVGAETAATYTIVMPAGSDLVATYGVGGNVAANLTASYAVLSSMGQVGSYLSAFYAVSANVGSNTTASYQLFNSVNADLTAAYDVAVASRVVDVASYTKSSAVSVMPVTNMYGTTLTVVVDKPAGVVAGDLLICVVAITGPMQWSTSAGSGFTRNSAYSPSNGAFPAIVSTQVVYTRIATASEPVQYSFNMFPRYGASIAPSAVSATMMRVIGADATAPFDVLLSGNNFVSQGSGNTFTRQSDPSFGVITTNKLCAVMLVGIQTNGAFDSSDTSTVATYQGGYVGVAQNTDIAVWQPDVSVDTHSTFVAVSGSSYIQNGTISPPTMHLDIPAIAANTFVIGIKPALAPPTTFKVGANLITAYNIGLRVASELTAVYDIAGFAIQDLVLTYPIGQAVGSNLVVTYNVLADLSVLAVGADLIAAYKMDGAIELDLVLVYGITSPVGSSLTATYAIAQAPSINIASQDILVQAGSVIVLAGVNINITSPAITLSVGTVDTGRALSLQVVAPSIQVLTEDVVIPTGPFGAGAVYASGVTITMPIPDVSATGGSRWGIIPPLQQSGWKPYKY